MNNVIDLRKKLSEGKQMATPEEIKLNILHSVGNYYVSNEGTKSKPNFHVWIPGVTHSTCDSTYADLSIAICRCNYLAKNGVKL